MTNLQYTTTTPETLEAFRNRPCSLPHYNADFRAPTPEEVQSLRRCLGLSQTKLARLVGVQWNAKGSNTVRKWETKQDSDSHRPISYSTWRLMLAFGGVIDPMKDKTGLYELD